MLSRVEVIPSQRRRKWILLEGNELSNGSFVSFCSSLLKSYLLRPLIISMDWISQGLVTALKP